MGHVHPYWRQPRWWRYCLIIGTAPCAYTRAAACCCHCGIHPVEITYLTHYSSSPLTSYVAVLAAIHLNVVMVPTARSFFVHLSATADGRSTRAARGTRRRWQWQRRTDVWSDPVPRIVAKKIESASGKTRISLEVADDGLTQIRSSQGLSEASPERSSPAGRDPSRSYLHMTAVLQIVIEKSRYGIRCKLPHRFRFSDATRPAVRRSACHRITCGACRWWCWMTVRSAVPSLHDCPGRVRRKRPSRCAVAVRALTPSAAARGMAAIQGTGEHQGPRRLDTCTLHPHHGFAGHPHPFAYRAARHFPSNRA